MGCENVSECAFRQFLCFVVVGYYSYAGYGLTWLQGQAICANVNGRIPVLTDDTLGYYGVYALCLVSCVLCLVSCVVCLVSCVLCLVSCMCVGVGVWCGSGSGCVYVVFCFVFGTPQRQLCRYSLLACCVRHDCSL